MTGERLNWTLTRLNTDPPLARRSLAGPVTNAPLAVADYRTLDVEEDMLVFASAYGTGYGIHHNRESLPSHRLPCQADSIEAHQRWSYIQHQMPSEVIFLRCFDTEMGAGGIAKFCPHVACDVLGEPELDGPVVPRTSIELRMVVLHN